MKRIIKTNLTNLSFLNKNENNNREMETKPNKREENCENIYIQPIFWCVFVVNKMEKCLTRNHDENLKPKLNAN